MNIKQSINQSLLLCPTAAQCESEGAFILKACQAGVKASLWMVAVVSEL